MFVIKSSPLRAMIHLLMFPTNLDYYRGAHGIALVYDVTNDASFQNIRKWIQDVHTYAEQNVAVILIGNKCDLVSKKVTSLGCDAFHDTDPGDTDDIALLLNQILFVINNRL